MQHTRRGFLKTALGAPSALALAAALPGSLLRAARTSVAERDSSRVLVVLQLTGGNDGLNTVVPFEDDVYARSRPTLRLRGEDVLKIDAHLGFHPQMPGFARLFKEGLLTVVQGVGYPDPSDDHFWSQRYWESARPHEQACQTGWLGRAADSAHGGDEVAPSAMFVGDIAPPFALNAERAFAPTITAADELALRTFEGARLVPPDAPGGAGGGLRDFVARAAAAACAGSERVQAVLRASRSGPTVEYPQCDVGRALATVAQLIRAELGVRVFFTALGGELPGGFDNHAIQAENHAALLRQLSASVAAFAGDLARDKLLGRVLLMTVSEFGRTVGENGRHGTGHASAAPMFLMGGATAGGLVGPHPSLTELEKGGPKHHTDFRRVYATVLDEWLGYDSVAALGAKYEHVAVLRK